MDIDLHLYGLVRLEVTSPDPDRLIFRLANAGIRLADIEYTDALSVHITIPKSACGQVFILAERNGGKCRILRKRGAAWLGISLLRRPVLTCGILLFVLTALVLSNIVLRVEVAGNQRIPASYILEQANACGIRFGSKTKSVRSEEVKNQLLSQIPQLQWVGVNTAGSVVTIQVKEREPNPAVPERKSQVAHVIAGCDAVISEITVHRGTPLYTPGKSVLAGEVIISGYTDCGLKVTAEAADGEVYGYTQRQLELLSPQKTADQTQILATHTCYRLKIGKKVINFCNHSGIQEASCDKMYSEDYWELPGGFVLPLSLIRVKRCQYKLSATSAQPREISWLKSYAEQYLCSRMVAGSILLENSEVQITQGSCRLSGSYTCHEMIGQVRYEETLEKHAENN